MIAPPPPLPGARGLFALDSAVAYLNHGSFGAVPDPVRRRRFTLIDEYDANPMRFQGGLPPRLAVARRELAAFVGADPELSALVANATAGAALVLNSLDWSDGDELVVTDHGYHGVTLAVQDLAQRCGVRVVVAPIELGAADSEAVQAVLEAVTPRTKLVIVDQISSATAQRHPVAQIAERLRELRVPFFVDGAHAPGQLPEPAAVGADFWVGNLHKWAFAPAGTALFQVSPRWRDRIRPLAISHGHPDGFPSSVEQQGNIDYTPWLAAPAGIDLFARYGEDAVRAHNVGLAEYGQMLLAQSLGLAQPLPDPGAQVSMRVIPLPIGTADDLAAALRLRTRIADELAVQVPVFPWRGQGLLRISAEIYNVPEDYQRLAEGLPDLL